MSSRLAAVQRALARIERFLDAAGFDRAPWLAVAFGTGIGLWFALDGMWHWLGLVALNLGLALAAGALLRAHGGFPYLRLTIVTMTLMVAAGCLTVWAKSAIVGTRPIGHAMVPDLTGRVLEVIDEPADHRSRLLIATREPRTDRPIRVQVTLPDALIGRGDRSALAEGAILRVRARLLPPAAPQLPGSFDFARSAWFAGISAAGTAIRPPQLLTPATGGHVIARARHALAAHVRAQVAGSAGGIAAVLSTGERGGIGADDAQAMRDAGLAHLLAVSGLHVSAVVGLAYFLSFRLLALIPAMALRVRLPLLAAGVGAIAGGGYTLLTGAQVPTVRAWLGTLLVMAALALGRQPLSMRLLAVAAWVVMLLWPESVPGASFQMSFGSVIAIIALHDARPLRGFLDHQRGGWPMRLGRRVAFLLLGGLVIDLALLPIALFQFHRAGVYGALANLVAIPLTTFVIMPLIALALTLDLVGWGAPLWWLTGKSLLLLLKIAHGTAALPGSVTVLPVLGTGRYVVFVASMLWLGLWRGRARLLALIPALIAAVSLAWLRAPDVMITGDGRNLGIVSDNVEHGGDNLLILREGRSRFTRDQMLETAGMVGTVAPLDRWPGARCNHDFCLVSLSRGARIWHILIARTHGHVVPEDLARVCAGVDIVIAQQRLPASCTPALIKADYSLLTRTGGLALDLVHRQVAAVAADEGDHPWWRSARLQNEGDDADPGSAPPNATVDMVKALPD